MIVAAALIMMSVFGSFILNGDPTVKQFGVGLSVGVALAAVMRARVLPGRPRARRTRQLVAAAWLDRVLPRIDVEGAGAQAEALPSDTAAAS